MASSNNLRPRRMLMKSVGGRRQQQLAAQLRQHFDSLTRSLDGPARVEVVKKFLKHPVLADIRPASVEIDKMIVENVIYSLKQLKLNGLLAARRATLLSATAFNPAFAYRIAKRLGVRGSRLAELSRKTADSSPSEILSPPKRGAQYRLSDQDRQTIEQFWEEQTKPSPRVHDIIRFRGRPGHIRHYLEVSQTELFLRFREAHPEITCSLRSFERLKPFFVKKLTHFNTCCCIHHIRMQLLHAAVLRTTSSLHGTACCCDCDHCQVMADGKRLCGQPKPRLSTFLKQLVCTRGEAPPDQACVMGKCSDCGTAKVMFCESIDAVVSWKQWEMISSSQATLNLPTARRTKKLQLVYKQTPLTQLLVDYKLQLQHYITHCHTQHWQASRYKELISDIPADSIVSCIDFAENFTFGEQDRPQSAYWSQKQATILVIITFVSKTLRSSSAGEDLKQEHFFISDDLQHDAEFAMHCLRMHLEWILHEFKVPQHHFLWSDGPSSQFKNNKFQAFASRYEAASGVRFWHSFWAPGHGKGLHDAALGSFKSHLRREQLKLDGVKLQSAVDVVLFGRETFHEQRPVVDACHVRLIERYFWDVPLGDVDRITNFSHETIPGTKSFYSWRSFEGENTIQTRVLSCFCSACLVGDDSTCSSNAVAGFWIKTIMKPADRVENSPTLNLRDEPTPVQLQRNHNDEDDLEPLSVGAMVAEGDFFAVLPGPDNNDHDDYWLLLCTRSISTASEDFIDYWRNEHSEGSQVLQGVWLEEVPEKSEHYVVLDNLEPVYLDPTTVISSNVPLAVTNQFDPEGRLMLCLSFEDHLDILEQARALQESDRSSEEVSR